MILILIWAAILQTSGHLHFQMVQSLCDIAVRHFTPGQILVISYSTPVNRVLVFHGKASRNLELSAECNTNEEVQKDCVNDLPSTEDLSQLILEELNKIEAWSLLFFNATDDFKESTPSRSNYEGYVLLSTCEEHEDVVKEIGQQVKKLRNTWGWNPRAKFVVLVMGVRGVNAKFLVEDILGELWTLRIMNSVVLIPALDPGVASGLMNVVNAYVWFPYQPTGKCPHDKDVTLQDRWVLDIRQTGYFLHSADLFPLKIPSDLQGCPLTVSACEVPGFVMRSDTTEEDTKIITYDKGVDVRILSELAKSTNSSINYREPPADGGLWGRDFVNGTWNGVAGEVSRGYSDIGLAGMWYRCHLSKEMECLRSHLMEKIRWYVPCAKPNPRWMSLIRVFKSSLWSGFFTAYVVISAIMWQVVKLTRTVSTEAEQNQAYSSLPKCLLNFWAIILEESASNNPPDVAAIRGVFFAWVLFCWAVNTVYQAYFTSFLIDPGIQHQLTSEDEILTSGIEYSTETAVTHHYPELQGKRYRHLNDTEEVDSAQGRVAAGNLAFLYAKYLVEYNIAGKYKDANGVPSICKLNGDFASSLVSIHVPKGFPLKPRYDNVLLSLLQAGLVNKWWEDLKYTASLEGAGFSSSSAGEYIVLTMMHLQSAFYLLLFGYSISVFSFLMELYFHYRQEHRRERIDINTE